MEKQVRISSLEISRKQIKALKDLVLHFLMTVLDSSYSVP